MALVNFTQPKFHVDDDNGNPLDSGKVYTYEAGTTTFKATYQDIDGSAQNSNPVILDSRGEADIFLEDGLYKFVIKDKEDTTVWTRDGIVVETAVNNHIVDSMASLLVAPRAGYMRTIGFYSAGDGGGMLFHWNGDEPKISHNGITIIDPDTTISPGESGWWTTTSTAGTGCWVATDELAVNCRTAGAKGDGVNDDAPACQAYATWAATATLRCYLPAGDYLFKSTVVIPAKVLFYGDGWGTTIYPDAAGVFTNDFVVSYNSTDCSTWDTAYLTIPLGGISGISFGDFSWTGHTAKAIFAAGGCKLTDIRTVYMYQTIVISSDYGDNVQIDNVHISYHQGVYPDYPIYVRNLGDNLKISNIFSGPENGLSFLVYGARGCTIERCLHGHIELINCDAVTMSNCHIETGRITIRNSVVTINDFFFYPQTYERIRIRGDGGTSCVTLNNVVFSRKQADSDASWTKIDVSLDGYSQLKVNNCKALTINAGYTGDTSYTGIYVGSDYATELPDWTKYAPMLSISGRVERNNYVPPPITKLHCSKFISVPSIVHSDTTSHITWNSATGTYYYQAIPIFDKARMIGPSVSSAEVSLALTNGDNAALLTFSGGNYGANNLFIRLYRGTSSGVYDYYVDIPAVMVRQLFDDGTRVNNYDWIARTAGGIDTLYDAGNIEYLNETVRVTKDSATAPMVGTWKIGDQIINIAPASGGFIGLVCTAGGTPGTWATFGAIT